MPARKDIQHVSCAKNFGWAIEWADTALRDLHSIDRHQQKRIIDKMEAYIASGDPQRHGKALSGEFTGYWRFRIGDYRAICSIEKQRLIVLVLRVRHRREIYRK